MITSKTNIQIPKCEIKQEIAHISIKKEVEEDDNFENFAEDFLNVEIKTEENDTIRKGLSNMSKKTQKIHCCVPLCDSYLQRGNFEFPKNANLKAKWLTALDLEAHGPRDMVCFKHFREKYDYCMQPRFDGTFYYKLSSDAVPSLCLPLKSHIMVSTVLHT